ncbi:hypothetical protein C1Y63_04495 [Corynebacterium sp. 13CS0277]|uniref:GNAT family N-acetyltransferase n=1 Tax=Corynebacterium sp. 13CS0277 TaxID=2071994 RepID=UPI000D022829|nr:GNAT family N-acetyltransferase [Corynebacterium sp. 13CS0277]PRQ11675.1 hypothetical protein C1Y63_04495 [Corynebacterium sp. 13CS0277]
MQILPMTLPRRGEQPAALAHSLVMADALATAQAFGSDDHAASLPQTMANWANAVRSESTVAVAIDEDGSDLPALGESVALPLGLPADADPDDTSHDPGLLVLPLGWVETILHTDDALPEQLDVKFTLSERLLPLPGEPLAAAAEEVLAALLAHARTVAAAQPSVRSLETWVDIGADSSPHNHPVAEWLLRQGFTVGLEELVAHVPVPQGAADPTLEERYTLHRFRNAIPAERYVDSLLELYQLSEDEVPHGDMTVYRTTWNRELLDTIQQANIAAGRTNGGVLIAEGDRVLAASVFGQPQGSRPHIASQGVTIVHPDARGRGLGLAIKQAALAAVAEMLPGVTKVMTQNAGINDAMLHVNQRLGMVVEGHSTGFRLALD